jgi:hypothetical protein
LIQSLTHLASFLISVPRQFFSHLPLLFCFFYHQDDRWPNRCYIYKAIAFT